MRTILLCVTTLMFVTTAYAEPVEQPAVPHAYYGRDGFWHCDPGYTAGASGGCELVENPQLLSAWGRLRELEMSERMNASVGLQAR